MPSADGRASEVVTAWPAQLTARPPQRSGERRVPTGALQRRPPQRVRGPCVPETASE